MSAVIVGREQELARVDAFLRGEGAPGLVLVGTAGAGKSCLLDAAEARAAERGQPVWSVRATAETARLPFGALLPLLSDAPRAELRGALIREVADQLDGLEPGTGGVLVVDDAHLLDLGSAAALQLVLERDRVRVILASRAVDPPPEAIAALWQGGRADRLDVGSLAEPALAALAAAVLGAPLDGAGSRRLALASEGNALFATELLRHALESGSVVLEQGVARFGVALGPSLSLRTMLEQRLAGLTGGEADVVDLLAVAGELGLDVLLGLGDPADLESLSARGLVTVRADGRRRPVRLAHPLYAELRRDGIDTETSRATHARLTEALSATGARRREDGLLLALWSIAAGATPAADELVEAARVAVTAWQPQQGLELARAALAAGAGLPAAAVAARALLYLGGYDEATDTLAASLEEAAEPEVVVAAANALSVVQFWVNGDEAAARASLDAAEARIGGTVAELEAQRATYAALAGRPVEAIELVDRLVAAGGIGAVVAAGGAGPAYTVRGRARDAVARADDAIRIAEGLEVDPFAVFTAHMSKAFALGELGELSAAAELVAEAYAIAVAIGTGHGQAWAAMLAGRTALLEGRAAAGLRWFREAVAVFDELHEYDVADWSRAGVAIAATMTGEHDAAREAAAPIATATRRRSANHLLDGELARAQAWVAWAAGDTGAALAALAAAADAAEESGALGTAVTLWHEMARFGDAASAAARFAERRPDVQGPLLTARLEFITAAAAEDADALEVAASMFTTCEAHGFAAEAAVAAARVHRQRAGGVAAGRLDQVGRNALDRCGPISTPLLAVAAPAGLSARQWEIARLAAERLSAKEIAKRLGLSARTVDNHLRTVYQRAGISGRRELAPWVASQDVPPLGPSAR